MVHSTVRVGGVGVYSYIVRVVGVGALTRTLFYGRMETYARVLDSMSYVQRVGKN